MSFYYEPGNYLKKYLENNYYSPNQMIIREAHIHHVPNNI